MLLNRDRIVGHPGLRAEAAQTLVLFILALLAAAVLLAVGGGVVNAWLFLTRAPTSDAGT